MFWFIVSLLISVVFLLVRVAFITLLERKLIARAQIRLGPNKTLLKGLVQPLWDGVKLLCKLIFLPFYALKKVFFFSRALVFIVIIIAWSTAPNFPLHSLFWFPFFLFIAILRVGIYGILGVGYRRYSKYAFIGRVRACAQTIRYEVAFALIVLCLVISRGHVGLTESGGLFLCWLVPCWAVSCLAETNRAPLDFAEGERELIRGLNIELGRFTLAYILVGEYGIVVFLSWFTSLLFLGGSIYWRVAWVFILLLARTAFPRFRYDKLIAFCWIIVLPFRVIFSRGTTLRRYF